MEQEDILTIISRLVDKKYDPPNLEIENWNRFA